MCLLATFLYSELFFWSMKTKIVIGSDHAGFKLKEKLKEVFSGNYNVVDVGTNSEESADYPDYAVKVGEKIADKGSKSKGDFGILVCGSGIGMSIAANKVPGIRAALCRDELDAEMSRRHNNANVVCLGERVSSNDKAIKIIKKFLDTEFEGNKKGGERHKRRAEKFKEIEKMFCKC